MQTIEDILIRPNMGRMDQSLRLVGGAVLVGVAFITGNLWCLFGLYPLVTGLVGSAPLYRLFGVESHRLGY